MDYDPDMLDEVNPLKGFVSVCVGGSVKITPVAYYAIDILESDIGKYLWTY